MYQIHKEDTFVLLKNAENNEVYKLELLRNHIEFGNLYIFSNILNMPALRREAYNLISQYEQIGVEKSDVSSVAEKCMSIINEGGNVNDIYTELSNLNQRLKDVWDFKKTAVAIVGLLIVPENQLQTIGTYEQALTEQNITLWAKDSALFDFFLRTVQIKINNFLNTLDADIVHYFPKATEQKSEVSKKKSTIWKEIANRLINWF